MADTIPQPKKKENQILKFLKGRTGRAPLEVPADITKDLTDPSKRLQMHKRMLTVGSAFSQQRLAKLLQEALATSYYRRTFYRECELAASEPLVSGALDLYTDSVCDISPLTNRVVWVTSEGMFASSYLHHHTLMRYHNGILHDNRA